MSPWHTVRQGDSVLSLVRQYNLADWKAIYDLSENASLKEKRPNPNILFPGDRVFIPVRRLRQEICQTGTRHKFKVKRPKAFVRVVLEDQDGDPLPGVPYTLTVGEETFEGTTGSDGAIGHSVPADAEEGELTVSVDEGIFGDDTRTWPVKIGYLDPTDEVSGVQGRLNNLGFHAGDVDGTLNIQTQAALNAFQARYGLEPTGEIDEATRQKLYEVYGI